MGFNLYREIRDRAPVEWTAGERLVALMIADDARDDTRKSWIKLGDLCARTGLRPRGVGDALWRLAGRGHEFRVPISDNKHGRPVFAANGHAVNYLVPRLPPRSRQGETLKVTSDCAKVTARRDLKGLKVTSQRDPSPQIDPQSPQSAAAGSRGSLIDRLSVLAAEEVLNLTGKTITADAARRGVTAKLDGHAVSYPDSWLRKVIANDPAWWLPADQPPRFRNGRFVDDKP